MTHLEPLSFEAFQAMLADLLNVDVAQLTPEAYFITDLGVDSIRMIEALLRLEEMGVTATRDQMMDMLWKVKDKSIEKKGLLTQGEFEEIVQSVLSQS